MRTSFHRNDYLHNGMLPVDIVLGPPWWHEHEGISFDEDFFFHPARRVEVERRMEQALYERWGRFGLGADRGAELPVAGAVHLAAGFLISQMLGCTVRYSEAKPPEVVAANASKLEVEPEAAFETPAFKRLETLIDALEAKYGYAVGDVNFGGILNHALDVRGQNIFMDMIDQPDRAARFFAELAEVQDRFTMFIEKRTGTSSVSVNRNVRHISKPVYLHSECSHVMISTADYERFLLPFDAAWNRRRRPFGVHYCGEDPHRFAESYAKLPHLDFLDVGWPGDVKKLREHLPHTFLNIRYSPVEIVQQSPDEIRATVRRLVHDSGNPYLTGVCCINMDDRVTDDQVSALFEEVEQLRGEYAASEPSA